MAKTKTFYKCTNCENTSPRWIGQCPNCQEWNSFVEKVESNLENNFLHNKTSINTEKLILKKLFDIKTETQDRMLSGYLEWDRVMGGGILPGSFIILTGDPGIGKSTLLLQVANKISSNKKVIYFSSEESLQQVKNRAQRLDIPENSNLLFSDQSNLEAIIQVALIEKPDILILDSIQNCSLSENSSVIPGTVGQLREAGFLLCKLAKENNIAILITGHITKEGHIAGPKVLEHIVDGVFYLQGEDKWQTRILRSVKNRFGTIQETGFFEMGTDGMQEVPDINRLILHEASENPGSALISSIEGSRPLLLELQSLCVTSKFGMPQRIITGIDPKRIILIAAILEKYLHIKFSSQDIFFKVSGGFKIKTTSCDLGIALSLLSSYFQKPLPEKSISIAEISLTGQIKPVNQIELQIGEAEKFGINKIFISKSQKLKSSSNTISFKNIYELIKLFPE
ncbi:MAG: repair protein radA protein [candidate division TM6 bacterium GW2011_GWF2_28_16]|nr:MAG: repair protein radA protein [candidate division TM6 bacterium GW2011_GWF2_28_16]